MRTAILGSLVGACLIATACGSSSGGAVVAPSGPTPMSSDATLSALVTSTGALSPAFVPTVAAYTVGPELLPDSVLITPTATDAAATITVDGVPVASGTASDAIILAIGAIQAVTVTVTAEDGVTQSNYVIAFVRADPSVELGLIKATNTDADDQFGFAAAMSGNTLVVGAPHESSAAAGVNQNQADNSAMWAGAAYVYVYENDVWTFQAYLKASNPDSRDRFGWSVDIDGDTIVVSAPFESSNATGVEGSQGDNTSNASGAVYVFTRSNGIWTQQAYVKASNTDVSDQFGRAVAISADTLAVGAQFEASGATGVNGIQLGNGVSGSGAVYVFTRAGTTWSQQAYVKASNTDANDHFGASVAVDLDTLVVGATGESSAATGVNGNQNDNSEAGSGAAYVFTRNGTTWTQQAYIKATNTGAADGFGGAIDVLNDTLAVGAPGEDSSDPRNPAGNSAAGAGAAYLYNRAGSAWTDEAFLKHPRPRSDDRFGWSLALERGMLLVGAPGDWNEGFNSDPFLDTFEALGAAFLFAQDAGLWSERALIAWDASDRFDEVGHSVAIGLSGGVLVLGTIIESSDHTGPNPVGITNNLAVESGAVYAFR